MALDRLSSGWSKICTKDKAAATFVFINFFSDLGRKPVLLFRQECQQG